MRSVTRSFILIMLLAVAGCGAAASSPPAHNAHHAKPVARTASLVISMRNVGQLGEVLTNNQGYALYMFAPDKRRKVTCVALCAALWPPVTLATGASFAPGHGIQPSLLGSDPNPDG